MEVIKRRGISPWASIALVLVALLTGIAIWIFNQTGATDRLDGQVKNAKVDFPMFYPKKLPEGFKAVDDSLEVQEDVVMYVLMHGDTKVVVSQQARPELMEEVEKLKDVEVSAGKAYIATLSERTAGFLLTDKTLLIVSTTKDMDIQSFESLLKAMVAL